MRILSLAADQYPEFGPRIAALEHGVSYPLGTDRFEIRHGADYFAFFRRLGDLSYFVAIDGDRIAGVLAAVLRMLPSPYGRTTTWYLCDLKAFGSHSRAIAPTLLRAFDEHARRVGVRHGYAISMNSREGANRLLAAAGRWLSAPPIVAGTLQLFSCDADTMERMAPVLTSPGTAPRYLSLAGVKDLVLDSTGRPMPLLHVQHGPSAGPGLSCPVAGAVHMFCLLDSDVRTADLRRFGVTPSATASIFVRSPIDVDFRCVLTSDI